MGVSCRRMVAQTSLGSEANDLMLHARNTREAEVQCRLHTDILTSDSRTSIGICWGPVAIPSKAIVNN